MTKLMSIIVGGALGLTLAASVGVGVAVGSNSEFNEAKAAETVFAEATFNATNNKTAVGSYTATWENVTDNFSWSISNFNNNNNGWELIKCGRKDYASTASISTISTVPVPITNVSINISALTKAYISSITLYGGSDATTSIGTFSISSGTQTVIVPTNQRTANQKYKIEFVCTAGKSNGLVTLAGVSLYADNSNKAVIVSGEEFELGTNNSEGIQVGATAKNISSPTYNWTTTNSNISLENANTSQLTIKPVNDNNGTATVTLTVGGTTPNLTKTITVYIYKQPYSVSEAKEAIDSGRCINDVQTAGIISQIDSYNSTYKSITYWISDDGSTNNQLQIYSGKGLDGADFTAKTDIEVGAYVTIKGNLKKYNSTYEYDTSSQQLSYVVKTLTSIAVSGSMTKTIYTADSQWNPSGLVVTATYSDNSTADVTSGATWSYNPAAPAEGVTSVVATASFGELTASSAAQNVLIATNAYTNGLPYRMYLVNTNLGKTYYFKGIMDGYYGATSESKLEAVDVVFENNANGGQNLYFMSGETKNYIYVSVSVDSDNKTHYNFAYGTSVPSTGWYYNGSCIVYQIDGVNYALGTYGTYTTIGASPASYNNNYQVQFEVSDGVDAETFASEFLSKLLCDSTGATAPTFAQDYSWNDLQVLFSQLPSSEQEVLRTATANESGSTVEQAMARYDYIVAKYSYNNFINRTISNSANRMSGIIDNNSVVMITVIMGLLATTGFAAFYMLRKKKIA